MQGHMFLLSNEFLYHILCKLYMIKLFLAVSTVWSQKIQASTRRPGLCCSLPEFHLCQISPVEGSGKIRLKSSKYQFFPFHIPGISVLSLWFSRAGHGLCSEFQPSLPVSAGSRRQTFKFSFPAAGIFQLLRRSGPAPGRPLRPIPPVFRSKCAFPVFHSRKPPYLVPEFSTGSLYLVFYPQFPQVFPQAVTGGFPRKYP